MALLAVVLLLLMLASIGFAALNVVERDQQVAGNLNRKAVALHAADAGISKILRNIEADGTPSLAPASLGDGSLFSHGQPSYRLDPTAADPIEEVGVGNLAGMNLQIGAGAAAQFQVKFWRLRVQGEAPGDTVARVEVLTGSLVAN